MQGKELRLDFPDYPAAEQEKDAERAAEILREQMEGAVELSVPLTVDLSTGKRWYGM